MPKSGTAIATGKNGAPTTLQELALTVAKSQQLAKEMAALQERIAALAKRMDEESERKRIPRG